MINIKVINILENIYDAVKLISLLREIFLSSFKLIIVNLFKQFGDLKPIRGCGKNRENSENPKE